MRGFFNFVKGFIIGGAIGAVVGLFLTPVAGEELRELIKDRIAYIIAEGRRAAEVKRREMEQEFMEARRPRYD